MATEESEQGNATLFNEKLNKLLNKTRIQDGTCALIPQSLILRIGLISTLVLPTLLQDIVDKADKWGNGGKNGIIDPFSEVYDVSLFATHSSFGTKFPYQLVFVMTARMTTCHDLVKNEADLKKISKLFLTLQTSSTPTSLLLPWFPSPARKAGKEATTELFTMLYTYVETRRDAELTSDAIDVLIAEGETTQNIVGVSPTVEGP